MEAKREALVFDRVLLRTGGTWNVVSMDEFFDLPLSDRIRHVIDRSVAFQLDGRSVDQKEALAAIRRLRSEPTTR
jgi:hypothetical protein